MGNHAARQDDKQLIHLITLDMSLGNDAPSLTG